MLANPVGVHPEMIRSGVDGFLVSSPDEWVEAVRTLLENPELRRRMGAAARQSVESNYSVKAWSPAFVAAISGARPLAALDPRRNHSSHSLISPGRDPWRVGQGIPPPLATPGPFLIRSRAPTFRDLDETL